jgi:hypothetical protein
MLIIHCDIQTEIARIKGTNQSHNGIRRWSFIIVDITSPTLTKHTISERNTVYELPIYKQITVKYIQTLIRLSENSV